jgi:FMN phosphatase YigB (HAD superfamily)
MWPAVCFDFDGTLAHYGGDFDQLLDGLRTDLGLLACDFATFKGRLAEATKRNGAVTLGSALAAVGLERHFRAVLISGDPDVARRKPDPRIFELACTALETTPQETVMVGDDADSDIAGARAIAMDAYLVRGRKSGHDHTQTVADLAELLDLLRERVEPSGR